MPKRKAARTAGTAARRQRGSSRRRADESQKRIEAALAAFAHDIRTPLTGIMALADLLATSELGARERAWVATLKSNAEHLAALTTVVVDSAKHAASGLVLREQAFDPRRFAADIGAALAARTAAKGLSTRLDIADDVPGIAIGDPVRLRAAIENIIDNAVKFTDAGEVTLRVHAGDGKRGRVGLAFVVTDTGAGMTAAEMRKLFRPFAQANAGVAKRYGGSGLGLVMVKSLARAMGGDLKVASAPGQGSAFTFTVALRASAEPPPQDLSHNSADYPREGRRLRVLCAEDNPYGRVVMNAILTELGHKIDFVGSGDAAAEAVARGGYDVVLMDITLAGTDGLAATRRIRARSDKTARTPVIGISGHASAQDETAAKAAGMDAYLAKPVSPRMLADTIARVVG